jgi:hypothetical protein
LFIWCVTKEIFSCCFGWVVEFIWSLDPILLLTWEKSVLLLWIVTCPPPGVYLLLSREPIFDWAVLFVSVVLPVVFLGLPSDFVGCFVHGWHCRSFSLVSELVLDMSIDLGRCLICRFGRLICCRSRFTCCVSWYTCRRFCSSIWWDCGYSTSRNTSFFRLSMTNWWRLFLLGNLYVADTAVLIVPDLFQ